MPDYIPRKDSELTDWGSNFAAIVAEFSDKWGIPETEVVALQNALANFSTLEKKASGKDKTSGVIADKNKAKKILVNNIRDMVKFRLMNPIITDGQRVDLGLHLHDTKPTTIPVPTHSPEIAIEIADLRRLRINFHEPDSDSKAKPYGVNGAVILYSVLEEPPASVDRLAHSVLATRTPHILAFTDQERGHTVYIAVCWQNERGQKGPFSAIVSALVP